MEYTEKNYLPVIKYLIIIVFGATISVLAWQIMAMESRFIIAITGLITFLSLCMIFIKRLEDILLYALVFNIPFSYFSKWLFIQEAVVFAKGVSLGFSEILLFLAYLLWFGQVFIAKTKKPPIIRKLDIVILLFILVNVISTLLASNKILASLDVIYTIKHALMYFFIVNVVKKRHIKGIVILILFGIALESGLAAFERITGYASFGAVKGDVASADFGDQQYKVPGIEDELRAGGTTNDSHTLGLYFAMTLPLPFVLMALQSVAPRMRFVLAGILFMGLVGLVVTFSRSGWFGFAIAAITASLVIIYSWKQGRTILIMVVMLFAASAIYPKAYTYVYKRVFEAPSGIMETRYDLHRDALEIWKNNIFFGSGPGNYMESFESLNLVQYTGGDDLPVHNAFLYSGAEIGLFGVIIFYAMIFISMRNGWIAHKNSVGLAKGVSLALMAGFAAYIIDGLTNPMYRQAVPYAQLWVAMAVVTALRSTSPMRV